MIDIASGLFSGIVLGLQALDAHDANRAAKIQDARYRGQKLWSESLGHKDYVKEHFSLAREEIESSPFYFPRSRAELMRHQELIHTLDEAGMQSAGELAARAEANLLGPSISENVDSFFESVGTSLGITNSPSSGGVNLGGMTH